MNQVLVKGMLQLTNIIESLYTKHMTLKPVLKHDVKGILHYFRLQIDGNLKEIYPLKVLWRQSQKDMPADLTIEIACYQTKENKFVINKDRIFTDRILEVKFYFIDDEEFRSIYSKFFLERIKKFKKPIEHHGPLEMTMCVPPDPADSKHPMYKTWMKQYLKFCEENPEFVKRQNEIQKQFERKNCEQSN